MESGKLAKAKNLGIVSGTQRRHLKSYNECIKRIHDGEIGELMYGTCYWNGGVIWTIDRKPEMTDMEWQLRNWNYFTWAGGDHYVEQHLHNIDIMNWVAVAVSRLPGAVVRMPAIPTASFALMVAGGAVSDVFRLQKIVDDLFGRAGSAT